MGHDSFEAPGSTLVGQSLLDLLPGFERGRIPGVARRQGDLRARERTKPQRLVARRTDGGAFPVEITSSLLPDEDDEVLLLVVRNLTDAVDVEVELRRQQRQTELILRAASEGIVGVDKEGKIVLANPAAARMLRFRASDLGGQDLHELIHHSRADGSPLPREECPIVKTLRSGKKHRMRDEVLWCRDGSPVVVELSTAPVLEGEAMVGAVMTFTDQSAIRAASRRNDELVSILQNELRGPLESVHRELRQLIRVPPMDTQGTLHEVADLTGRLIGVLDDVLDFQRFETGEIPLHRRTSDLRKLIQTAVAAASELAETVGVGIDVRASPVDVVVDEGRMVQAFTHLLVDAVSASTAGGTVVVAAARRGSVARVEVRGPVGNGSPLHLPIARGVVERHGGTLRAHELPGLNTTYVIELPLEAPLPGRQLPPASSEDAPSAALGGGINGSRRDTGHARHLRVPSPPIPRPTGPPDAPTQTLPPPPSLATGHGTRAPEVPRQTLEPAVDTQTLDLLVWPEPDGSTSQALEERGYRMAVVRADHDLDRLADNRPAALFVDPLTGPITRTTLQRLRGAAELAHIPVLVTAGLGEAARGSSYGADPAVLLRALAPAATATDVPLVLIVEDDPDIAAVLESGVQQRGMEAAHAASESEAVSRAATTPPNLVVLDLMLVRRRRVGIVDWLRNYGRLQTTPVVVYTGPDGADSELRRLRTGETALYLTERSTGVEVQQRLMDLVSKVSRHG